MGIQFYATPEATLGSIQRTSVILYTPGAAMYERKSSLIVPEDTWGSRRQSSLFSA